MQNKNEQKENKTNVSDRKVLLRISDLKQYFPVKKEKLFQKEQLYVKANDGISLDIYEGETVGLVGESGCGKSTFGRVLLQLYHQTAGQTIYYGRTIDDIAPEYVKDIYKNLGAKKKQVFEFLNAQRGLESKPNDVQLSEKEELERKEKEVLFDQLKRLVGGLLVMEDTEAVSKAYLRRYEVQVKIRDLKLQYQPVHAALASLEGEKEKSASKISNLKAKQQEFEAKLSSLQDELKVAINGIESLKKPFLSQAEFEEYEACLDDGIDLAKLNYKEIRILRKDLQLIFQDPYSSLNPRMTVGQIIGEGLSAHNLFKKSTEPYQNEVERVMENCGLAPYMIHRYPHQFSGGQRQRIGIARSLALKPKFVVCDEAVSALDVSIQSQIINLLLDLKEKENLTYLFISHDLSVIKYISDRIGVMYLGNMVELATTKELFDRPVHPYTEALLSAIPTTDSATKKEAIILEGDIPSPIKPPNGCKFNTRCRYCTDVCREQVPEWEEVAPGHFVACHHKRNMK